MPGWNRRRWGVFASLLLIAGCGGDEEAHVARAQRSLKAAQKQQQKRGTDLGVQAAQARLDLAVMRQGLAEKRLGLARLKVHKARAELELDKARQVVLYDLVAVRG